MKDSDVMSRCVILCGAEMKDCGFLGSLDLKKDFIIAADAGYLHAKEAGIRPHLVVGDFDSYKGEIDAGECIRLPAEKDDTDTLFAAREGIRRGFKEFLFIGALGGRIDHMIANFCVLRFLCDQGAYGVLKDESTQVEMLLNGRLELMGKKGDVVSIFPFDGVCEGVDLEGFKYPLKNATLTSSFPIGVSNELMGNQASISVKFGALLIIRTRYDL